MCRFIFYRGPRMTLSSLVSGPSHGLLAQSQKAHCPRATLNADGFGLAWYAPDVSPIPAIYKDITPAWSNPNLKQIARVTQSECILAHVRAASTGAVTQTNCHPFSYRNMSFMHNGTVAYFSQIKRRMMSTVSEHAFNNIQGHTDSELMFAMFITNFEKLAGFKSKISRKAAVAIAEEPYDLATDWTATMANAMKLTLTQVHQFVLDYEAETSEEEASDIPQEHTEVLVTPSDDFDGASMPETKAVSRLNLCVTDGRTVVVSRYTTGSTDTAHTLYWSRGQRMECTDGGECRVVKQDEQGKLATLHSEIMEDGLEADPGMVVVSSEPLDKSYECAEVPVNHLVVVGPKHFSIRPVC